MLLPARGPVLCNQGGTALYYGRMQRTDLSTSLSDHRATAPAAARASLLLLAVAGTAAGCGGAGGTGGVDGGPGGSDGAGLPADTQAPQFDGASSAAALLSAIRLDWTAAMDDVTPASGIVYAVYQADSAGGQDFAQPTLVTQPGATSAVMGGLPVSSTFFYVVRARDAAGNEDGNTAEVSATTPDVADETPPTFAGAEAAVPVGSSSMTLSWQPASDDVTPAGDIVYRVYMAEVAGGQDFSAPLLTTPAGATEALVSELAANTTYYFVVRAVDAAGNEEGNTAEISAAPAGATSFSAQVLPILIAECATGGCHSGRMPAESLSLEEGLAYAELVGVAASQCAERTRVTPGAPEASYLMDKLLGVDMCAGTRMPKSGSLSEAEMQTISDWITEGALDN